MRFVTEEGARVTRFLSRDDDDDDVTSYAEIKSQVKVKLNSSTPGETIQQFNVLLCSLFCGLTLGLFCINSPFSIYFRDVSDQLQSRGSSDLGSPDGQKRFWGNPVRNNFTGGK